MAEAATRLPVGQEKQQSVPLERGWDRLEDFREEMNRLMETFPSWLSTVRRSSVGAGPNWQWGASPAVDIVEKDTAYEVTAELPGIEEKNVEVKCADGVLTIWGEKEEAKEEKRKGYHLAERRYGSFRRSFSVPDGIDGDRIEASFAKGVLTVVLPKSHEIRKKEKKIAISAH